MGGRRRGSDKPTSPAALSKGIIVTPKIDGILIAYKSLEREVNKLGILLNSIDAKDTDISAADCASISQRGARIVEALGWLEANLSMIQNELAE